VTPHNTCDYGDYQENQASAKKEVMFTSCRLQKLDLDVMEAFVVKEVEAVELHVACYPER